MIVRNIEPIEVRTKDGWIVVLQYAPWTDKVELYIGKQENNKFYRAVIVGGGNIEMVEAGNGDQRMPTLNFNSEVWYGLSEALRGVTPEIDKKVVDAELKATKYHLEDMRTLVLKTKGGENNEKRI